ncbi:MAG TPA: glucose 1-dehydrogenase [Victivallales bacterium]|nr:glucose 1-dehydrogenase [Victivallales bacterium]
MDTKNINRNESEKIYNFKGKTVLINGGTSGIGKESVYAFANNGANVIFTGRREIQGWEIADEIKKTGGKATFMRMDITDEENVKSVINTIVNKYGKIDYAFNNAGIEALGKIVETDSATFDKVMTTNAKGVFLAMKYEIEAMKKTGGGSIVNTASAAGVKPFKLHTVYCASKHAVIGMSKVCAFEYAQENIRINTVAPGFIESDMSNDVIPKMGITKDEVKNQQPIKRIGQPIEVVNVVLWLCSDQASFVVGENIMIDGGLTL